MRPVIRAVPARSATRAALAKTSIDSLSVVGFKGSQAGVEQLALRHNDQVEARRELVATENLSNQSFRSIPHHRASQLPRRRDAKATHRERVGQNEHGAVTAANADSPFVRLLEFSTAPDTFVAPEPRHAAPIRC
jgi:hypothetical protein